VLFFALTALVFSACSSSGGGGGNGGGPIEGNVIIPNDYSSKYPNFVVYVCSDEDRSNSCKDTETYVKANTDGSFTITAGADIPLVAEFYATDPLPSPSSVSVSSLGDDSNKPILVYTTPAGKRTVSAFTTMVKNRADLNPNIPVEVTTEEVKIASGISDPFDPLSYTGNAGAVHDVVSELVEGVLEYITGTLGQMVDASPAIVAALYDVIFQLVESIADDPDTANANKDALISDVESDIEQAIEDTETALDEAATSGNWDISEELTLYNVVLYGSIYFMQVFSTGNIWVDWEPSEESVAILRYEGRLPEPQPQKLEDAVTLPLSFFAQRISATVTSPNKLFTSEKFNQQISLSPGAKIYTLILPLEPDEEFDIEELRGDTSSDMCYHERAMNAGFNLSVILSPYDKITLEANNKFRWINTGYHSCEPFAESLPFDKSGTYTQSGSGQNELYIFTATDGSKAVLYHKNNNPSQWYLGINPKVYFKEVFFNNIAAENVRDQLNTSIIPQ
jgi:hypothetical protein